MIPHTNCLQAGYKMIRMQCGAISLKQCSLKAVTRAGLHLTGSHSDIFLINFGSFLCSLFVSFLIICAVTQTWRIEERHQLLLTGCLGITWKKEEKKQKPKVTLFRVQLHGQKWYFIAAAFLWEVEMVSHLRSVWWGTTPTVGKTLPSLHTLLAPIGGPAGCLDTPPPHSTPGAQAFDSVEQLQCFLFLLCSWVDSPEFVCLCQIPRKSWRLFYHASASVPSALCHAALIQTRTDLLLPLSLPLYHGCCPCSLIQALKNSTVVSRYRHFHFVNSDLLKIK